MGKLHYATQASSKCEKGPYPQQSPRSNAMPSSLQRPRTGPMKKKSTHKAKWGRESPTSVPKQISSRSCCCDCDCDDDGSGNRQPGGGLLPHRIGEM